MSPAQELREELRALGATLTVQDGRLALQAPPGALTDALRAKIAEHREALLSLAAQDKPRPWLTPSGELRIPFGSDRRYWWWAGGQDLLTTLRELGASEATLARYVQKRGTRQCASSD